MTDFGSGPGGGGPDEGGPDRDGADRDGADRDGADRDGADRDGERVAQLLAGLADDPDAPPSTVTAMSVIAAARAAARPDAGAPPYDRPAQPEDLAGPAAAGTTADVIEFRPRRRRFALAGLVAAASLAGISALVISLTVTGGSSTSTSADGARAASAESAGSVESAAAAQPPGALAAASAAAPQAAGEADAAAGGAQDNSAAVGDESAAAGSGQDSSTGAGCWPALSDRTLIALTGSLPSGAFGAAMPLTADCEPGAIGGAILPGTAPGTALVARVSAAGPGACISDTSVGTACVARGDNVYLAGDESGAPVIFAYGNGDQVVISGWPGTGDSVPLPSGLTVEQAVVAAEAVLGAIG